MKAFSPQHASGPEVSSPSRGLTVSFRHMEPCDSVRAVASDKFVRLKRHTPSLMRCEITLSGPNISVHPDGLFECTLTVHDPQGQVSVHGQARRGDTHNPATTALAHAFSAAERRLQRR